MQTSKRALIVFGVFLVTFGFSRLLAAAPPHVWVDAQWADQASCAKHTWHVDAFSRIQDGIVAVADGGTVTVNAGSYPEWVKITKPLTLAGPGSGVSPDAPTVQDPLALNPARGQADGEAVILPPTTNLAFPAGMLLEIQADNVTIDGFTINGANPALKDGVSLNGVLVQAAAGIGSVKNRYQGITITNNIIRNLEQYGVHFVSSNDDQPATSQSSVGNAILDNDIDNLPEGTDSMPDVNPGITGRAIRLGQDFDAMISGNTITRAAVGIYLHNYVNGEGAYALPVTHNHISAYLTGIGVNLVFTATNVLCSHNDIQIIPRSTPVTTNRYAVYILTIAQSVKVVMDANELSGGEAGVFIWNLRKEGNAEVTIKGGTIRGARYGVWLTNTCVFGADPVNRLIISGVQILDSTAAGIFVDDEPGGIYPVNAIIANDTLIKGGPVGVLLRGQKASVQFSRIHPPAASFAEQQENYIKLDFNGLPNQGRIDATNVRFAGKFGAEMNAAEVTALESKLADGVDMHKSGRISCWSTKLNLPNLTAKAHGQLQVKTVLTAAAGWPVAGKTLYFSFNKQKLGTATTDAQGGAALSLNLNNTPAGAYTVTVLFPGDGKFPAVKATCDLKVVEK